MSILRQLYARRVLRSALLLSAVAAATICPASVANAYRTLADVEGTASPIVWDSVPTVSVDSATFPADLAPSVAIELEEAVSIWNRVSCTPRLVEVTQQSEVTDIRVRFEPDWASAGFNEGAAATTDLVFQSGSSGGELVEAVIHLNADIPWRAHDDVERASHRSLRVVLLHELGHALGLAHVCEVDQPEIACAPEHVQRVMHPRYEDGSIRLAADDLEGICALYAERVVEPPSCTENLECFEGEVCREGDCQPDDVYGGACSQRSDCTSTYCIEASTSPAGGICTRPCEATDECPSGAECLPLESSTLRVCSPLESTASCAITSRGGARGAPATLLILAGVLLLRRRRGRNA